MNILFFTKQYSDFFECEYKGKKWRKKSEAVLSENEELFAKRKRSRERKIERERESSDAEIGDE